MADCATFFKDTEDNSGGRRLVGGDLREVEGEIRDCEKRGRWDGVRIRVFAVMVFH